MTVARAARMGLCEASRQKQSDGDDRLHGLFLIFDVRKSDIKLPAGRVGADYGQQSGLNSRLDFDQSFVADKIELARPSIEHKNPRPAF